MIYADSGATTKVCDKVVNELAVMCREGVFGNASSVHSVGVKMRALVEGARGGVSRRLGCQNGYVSFNSGGTEANNQALRGLAEASKQSGKRRIISSKIEHPSVLNVLRLLERDGFEVVFAGTDNNGVVDLDEIGQNLSQDTAFVSVMYANNVTGVIQPVAKIGALCRGFGVPYHSDGVQAAGHVPVNMAKSNISLMSISAHKFGGLQGVGALCFGSETKIPPFMLGGGQENGTRSGTENIYGIVGLDIALSENCINMQANMHRTLNMRNRLENGLLEINGAHILGRKADRLPGTCTVCLPNVLGETAVLLLSEFYGICASAGSACSSGDSRPSEALLSMGLTAEEAKRCVRFTLSHTNTEDEITKIVQSVKNVVNMFDR